MSNKMYMHVNTGSVDTVEGWAYEDENGKYTGEDTVEACLKSGDFVEVVKDEDGEWVEV
jgi:hypothetical protein